MRRASGASSPLNDVGSAFGSVASRTGSNISAAGLEGGASGTGMDPEAGPYEGADVDALKKVRVLLKQKTTLAFWIVMRWMPRVSMRI